MKLVQVTTQHAPYWKERMCAFSMAAACSVLGYRYSPHGSAWLVAALAGIALAIWHGAYDEVLAEKVLPARLGPGWRLPFFTAYLALAGLVLLLWWLAPVLALPVFLLYSAVHFGTEAEPGSSPLQFISATAMGFLPVAASCRWWPSQVSELFAIMLRGQYAMANRLAHGAGTALVVCLVLALAGPITWERFCIRLTLAGTQLALFRFCPPLLAFAVYFCLWHTPEHLLETSHDAQGHFRPGIAASNLKQGLVPWLVSVTAMGLAGWIGRHTVQAYAGLVFVGLSALTVPHMALGLLHQHGHSLHLTEDQGQAGAGI